MFHPYNNIQYMYVFNDVFMCIMNSTCRCKNVCLAPIYKHCCPYHNLYSALKRERERETSVLKQTEEIYLEIWPTIMNHELHSYIVYLWQFSAKYGTLQPLSPLKRHAIKLSLYKIIHVQFYAHTCTCCIYNTRVFDKFWSMGQIGSTIVSVCAIGNTSWAN